MHKFLTNKNLLSKVKCSSYKNYSKYFVFSIYLLGRFIHDNGIPMLRVQNYAEIQSYHLSGDGLFDFLLKALIFLS